MRLPALLLSLFCFISASSAATTVIFGDSYSDEGRIYALSGNTYPLPEPYFWEGRFSNGPVWAEYAFSDRQNFAYGGAESNKDNVLSDPEMLGSLADNTGLLSQIEEYISSSPSDAAHSNFIIYIGTNDMMEMLDPENTDALTLNEVVANIETAAMKLKAAGAVNVTIFGLTDLAYTPWAKKRFSDRELLSISTQTAAFNRMLKKMVFKHQLAFYDANKSFMQFINHPEKYGFTDIEHSCLNYSAGIACDHPDEYLFWDHIHPTTMAHEGFAKIYQESNVQ